MEKNKTFPVKPVKALVYCAMLAAVSVVMARLLSLSVAGGARWSLDKFPLFLAGLFFGPVMGGITGFVADLIGSLMQYGFNPFLWVPAVLYGVAGGLLRWFLLKKFSVFRLVLSYLIPTVLGSILIQSFALSFTFPKVEGYWNNVIYYLGTRGVQFTIILVLETLIIYAIMRSNLFFRLGVWPKVKPRGGEPR